MASTASLTPPPALVRLFRQLDDTPYWLDWDRIERGGSVFMSTGLFGIAVLNLFALPIMYYSPTGNKPLVFTGHLIERAPRRLAETGRFVLETSKPGGLRRFADGFAYTVKVRLMHAQVRRLLMRSGRWNPDWGQPVNQLYMAGTNVALSTGLIEGLGRIGYRLSSRDCDALLHMWRYSGYLSGLDPELQISTQGEGRSLGEFIKMAEAQPDKDSKNLISALMTAAYHPKLKDQTWPAKVSYGISRKLIGNELANDLEYPKSHFGWLVYCLYLITLPTGWIQRSVPGAQSLSARCGIWIWERMIAQVIAGTASHSDAPPRLRETPAQDAKR